MSFCILFRSSPRASESWALSQTLVFHFHNPHCSSLLKIEAHAAPSSGTTDAFSDIGLFHVLLLWWKCWIGLCTTSMIGKSRAPIRKAFGMLSFSHHLPKKLSWVKNITYEWMCITCAAPSRPIARSARGELCVCVCFLNTHSMDLLPPPLCLWACTYTHVESCRVMWRQRTRQTSNPFILNHKL